MLRPVVVVLLGFPLFCRHFGLKPKFTFRPFRSPKSRFLHSKTQQTRVYPYPLGAGSARPNPKKGGPDPENLLFLGFSVLRGGLRPWSQTMVSEGARPWAPFRTLEHVPDWADTHAMTLYTRP